MLSQFFILSTCVCCCCSCCCSCCCFCCFHCGHYCFLVVDFRKSAESMEGALEVCVCSPALIWAATESYPINLLNRSLSTFWCFSSSSKGFIWPVQQEEDKNTKKQSKMTLEHVRDRVYFSHLEDPPPQQVAWSDWINLCYVWFRTYLWRQDSTCTERSLQISRTWSIQPFWRSHTSSCTYPWWRFHQQIVDNAAPAMAWWKRSGSNRIWWKWRKRKKMQETTQNPQQMMIQSFVLCFLVCRSVRYPRNDSNKSNNSVSLALLAGQKHNNQATFLGLLRGYGPHTTTLDPGFYCAFSLCVVACLGCSHNNQPLMMSDDVSVNSVQL